MKKIIALLACLCLLLPMSVYFVAADGTLTIPEANELGLAQGQNSYTAEKYSVTGKIVGISNTQYGNMYIADDNGNQLFVYGIYDATGEVRYDALDYKPVVGDTITLLGVIGTYNGNEAQMKNGWLTNVVKGEGLENTDPKANSVLTIAEAIELGASKMHNIYTENKYYITGTITEVYSDIYGNMYVTDGNGNTLTIYGTWNADGTVRYDALETKPVAGDTIILYGIIGQYSNKPQMKNGWIVDELPAEPELPAGDTLTIPAAIELGLAQGANTYTADKYYVTGEIVAVSNSTYGNMYIVDAEGNQLLLYGSYSADGEVRYDELEYKPVAGDTVTVYGVVGTYNGNEAQMKNVWITDVVKGEGVENTDPAADSVLSIEEAIALGASKLHNVYTENKYYVTGVITEVYSDIYGNMYIADEAGNTLTIYGTWNEDGTVRYDALETQPVAGDTIILYGIIGQYNSTPQMKNGWIVSSLPEIDDDDNNNDSNNDNNTDDGNTDNGNTDNGNTDDGNIDDGNTDNGNNDTQGETDKMGENTAIIALAAVLMALAAAGVIVFNKKRA